MSQNVSLCFDITQRKAVQQNSKINTNFVINTFVPIVYQQTKKMFLIQKLVENLCNVHYNSLMTAKMNKLTSTLSYPKLKLNKS